MATAKKKAPAKKAASKQPNPPSPAKAAGKAAGAKMSKETSAVTRAKAAAYKKSGAGYMKKPEKSMAGDLGGPNWGQVKEFSYGAPIWQMTRTEKRSLDQDKRAKTKSGKGYLKPYGGDRETLKNPYFLSKGNDLSRGRTSQRGKDQAKRKKK
jgi:hypothetical protein